MENSNTSEVLKYLTKFHKTKSQSWACKWITDSNITYAPDKVASGHSNKVMCPYGREWNRSLTWQQLIMNLGPEISNSACYPLATVTMLLADKCADIPQHNGCIQKVASNLQALRDATSCWTMKHITMAACHCIPTFRGSQKYSQITRPHDMLTLPKRPHMITGCTYVVQGTCLCQEYQSFCCDWEYCTSKD